MPPKPDFSHYTPYPHGIRVHELMAPKHGSALRIVCLVTGYGAGKSYLAARETIKQAIINAPTPVLQVSPSYSMAQHNAFIPMQRALDAMGIQYSTRWDTQHRITLTAIRGHAIHKNVRPEILFRSADVPEGLKGLNVAMAWVDEPGIIPELTRSGETFIEIVLARVRAPEAKCLRVLLTGTPEGRNWFYQFAEADPSPNTYLVRASTRDNPEMLRNGYYQQLLERYDAKKVAMYADGIFVDLSDARCYLYEDEVNMRTCTYNPDLPVYITIDFNRTPSIHALMAQLHGPRDDPRSTLQFFTEFVIAAGTTQKIAIAMDNQLQVLGHKQPVYLCGDPSGRQKRSNSDLSDVDVLVQALSRWKPTVLLRNVHQAQSVSVDTANAALEKGRVLIDPSCRTLIYDLRNVRWKPNCQFPSLQLDKSDPKMTHASDAMRYLVEQLFPLPARPSVLAMVGGDKRPSTMSDR